MKSCGRHYEEGSNAIYCVTTIYSFEGATPSLFCTVYPLYHTKMLYPTPPTPRSEEEIKDTIQMIDKQIIFQQEDLNKRVQRMEKCKVVLMEELTKSKQLEIF